MKKTMEAMHVSCGVFHILQNDEGEEIAKSRDIEDIAEAISEDQDILGAYEEEKINFDDLSPFSIDELKNAVNDLRFKENFSYESED